MWGRKPDEVQDPNAATEGKAKMLNKREKISGRRENHCEQQLTKRKGSRGYEELIIKDGFQG